MLDRGYILLPQPIEEEAVRMLKDNGLEVVVAPDVSHDTVAPLMKDARAVVLRTGIKLTDELMDQAEDLLTISRTGAGFDNVDVDAATKRGIIVTSSIGMNTISVAEHCMALILTLFKQFFLLDREVRKGNFKIRFKNLPQDLEGKTLGVIGVGRIGKELISKVRAFGMRIVAWSRSLTPEKAEQLGVEYMESPLEVASASDIVSVHLALTGETKDFLGSKFFEAMKAGAYIINTSRGGVVNEKDLIDALEKGKLAGAGLDVFEKEPILPDNPLLKMENVIITPHTAALTAECVVRMAVSAVERVIDLLNGVKPESIANPEVLRNARWGSLKER